MLSLVLVSSPALQMAPLATVPAARTAAPLMQGMMAPYDAPSNAEFHRNRRRSYRNWGRNGRRNWGPMVDSLDLPAGRAGNQLNCHVGTPRTRNTWL